MRVLFLVTAFLCGAFSEERGLTAAEEKTLEGAGLAHLPVEDKRKCLAFSRRLAIRAINQDGGASASRYLEDQGYKLVTALVQNIRGTEVLIVETSITKWITKDVPIGMSTISMPEGKYWTQTSTFGVSELIDKDGRVYRTNLCDWKELE